jgi:hypothetical protein
MCKLHCKVIKWNFPRPGWRSRYSDLLRSGWPMVRIPPGSIEFLFFKTVQTGSGAHTTSYLMGRKVHRSSTSNIPRLRMNGAIPLLLLYVFMSWRRIALLFTYEVKLSLGVIKNYTIKRYAGNAGIFSHISHGCLWCNGLNFLSLCNFYKFFREIAINVPFAVITLHLHLPIC